MAEAINSDNKSECLPERGRVRQVSAKWRVYEDGAIAERMQNDEFDYKYGLNRYNRRTVREDIPVAKVVHSKEEERLQKEHFEHLQKQKQIADRDAEIARKAQEEEQRRIQIEKAAIETNDAVIATQFQTAELIESERARVQMEMSDEAIAKRMQEKEKEKFERKRMEREIAKQRKMLQREQAEVAGNVLAGRMESGVPQSQGFRDMRVTEDERVLRTDGKVEDAGDFNDFYIQPSDDMDPQEMKELRELQDEELARLLQDQEKKRGSHVNKDKLRQIEEKDAEIARLIFEQEKLKVKKHKHKHSRQISEPGGRGDTRNHDKGLHKTASLPVSYPVHQENSHNDALEERLGRISIDTSPESPNPASPHHHSSTATYLNPRQRGNHQQHSPSSQNSSDRDLPPYRPPPPISATQQQHNPSHQQQYHSHGSSSTRSDTPPYERPPVPPHPQFSQPDYAEYASRPLPKTPESQLHSQRPEQQQYSHDHRSTQGMYPPNGNQPAGNVFTAIDPTARNSHPDVVNVSQSRSRPPTQSARSPPAVDDDPLSRSDLNYAEHLAAQAVTGTPGREVEYADLNDMSPPVVQGHKRSSLQRDKKKNSCKQQ